jgi:hypothetical protein
MTSCVRVVQLVACVRICNYDNIYRTSGRLSIGSHFSSCVSNAAHSKESIWIKVILVKNRRLEKQNASRLLESNSEAAND